MKHRILNIAILIAFLLDYILFWGEISFYWIALGLIICHSTVFMIGVFRLSFGFFTPVYFKGESNKIYLSYDDGPDEKQTPLLLDLLKQENIQVGFFVIGKEAVKQLSLIEKMKVEGHLVANHSYTHHQGLQFFSTAKVMEELNQTEAIINPEKTENKYFRPPIGIMNPKISRACKRLKYNIIGWNLRTYDTQYTDIEKLWNRTKKQLNQGKTVVLMHDNRPISLELTKRIIAYAKEKGMVFERIDEITKCR